MGLDFRDTIIVRRTLDKGTRVVEEPVQKQNWTGEEFFDYEQKRLTLAGDLMVMSAKGTKSMRLSAIDRKRPTLPKGYTISVGKGTGTMKLE